MRKMIGRLCRSDKSACERNSGVGDKEGGKTSSVEEVVKQLAACRVSNVLHTNPRARHIFSAY